MGLKIIKDSYLKKELRKLTHNKKLNRVLKKIDRITKFRRDDTPNKQYKTFKETSGAEHPVLLIDPNVTVL